MGYTAHETLLADRVEVVEVETARLDYLGIPIPQGTVTASAGKTSAPFQNRERKGWPCSISWLSEECSAVATTTASWSPTTSLIGIVQEALW